jgi:hypothetical protein
MRRALRVRQVLNAVNGSTLCGLAIARLGGARLGKGPGGLVLATGYGLPIPKNLAFTVGNVVISRRALTSDRMLQHEAKHATQWAACLGLPMLPLYGVASAWSWLRTRDYSSRNMFERLAGLDDGGYRERAPRPLGAPRLPFRHSPGRAT